MKFELSMVDYIYMVTNMFYHARYGKNHNFSEKCTFKLHLEDSEEHADLQFELTMVDYIYIVTNISLKQDMVKITIFLKYVL